MSSKTFYVSWDNCQGIIGRPTVAGKRCGSIFMEDTIALVFYLTILFIYIVPWAVWHESRPITGISAASMATALKITQKKGSTMCNITASWFSLSTPLLLYQLWPKCSSSRTVYDAVMINAVCSTSQKGYMIYRTPTFSMDSKGQITHTESPRWIVGCV